MVRTHREAFCVSFSGHLALRAESRANGRTVLAEQAFRAPFHVSKPYWDGETLLVQVVNPTAGILSGDTMTSAVHVDRGAALLVTTPSASRVFRMNAGRAMSRQQFSVDAGGWLEFWPEPLVPHANSVFEQTTTVDAKRGAEFLFADFLLPGRLARGEAWAWTRLRLTFQLRIDGELILRERFDQSGAELRQLAAMANRAAGAAFGTLVLGSEKLEDERGWADKIRALHDAEISVGLTRLRGAAPCFAVKIIAPDGDALRRTLRAVRAILAVKLPKLSCDPRKL